MIICGFDQPCGQSFRKVMFSQIVKAFSSESPRRIDPESGAEAGAKFIVRHGTINRNPLLALLALAPVISGCSGASDLLSKDADWFSRSGRVFVRNISIETPPLTPNKPVTAEELVSAEGGCPGMAPPGGRRTPTRLPMARRLKRWNGGARPHRMRRCAGSAPPTTSIFQQSARRSGGCRDLFAWPLRGIYTSLPGGCRRSSVA